MSITMIEGFGLGIKPTGTGITEEEGGYTIGTTSPRTGSYYAAAVRDTTGAGLILAMGTLTVASGWSWLGFGFRRSSVTAGHSSVNTFPIAGIKDSGSNWVFLYVTERGSLVCDSGTVEYSALGATPIGALRGEPVLAVNSWSYIEFGCTIQDAGQIEVRVDGMTVLTASDDTRIHGTAATTTRIGYLWGAQETGALHDFADIYTVVDDGVGAVGRIGPIRVPHLLPTSDTTAQFTRSTGADNFALVDERPSAAADYVESTTAAQRDLYGLGDLSQAGTIRAIALKANATNPDAGSAGMKLLASSNAVESLSASRTLVSTSTNVAQYILETNPDGSVAWVDAAVDALLAGYEIG